MKLNQLNGCVEASSSSKKLMQFILEGSCGMRTRRVYAERFCNHTAVKESCCLIYMEKGKYLRLKMEKAPEKLLNHPSVFIPKPFLTNKMREDKLFPKAATRIY